MMTHGASVPAVTQPASTTAGVQDQQQQQLPAPTYFTGQWTAGWPANQGWHDQMGPQPGLHMMPQDRPPLMQASVHSSPQQADVNLFSDKQHPSQRDDHQKTVLPPFTQFVDTNQRRQTGIFYCSPGGDVKTEPGNLPGSRLQGQGFPDIYPGVQSQEQQALMCWRRQCSMLEADAQKMHSQNLAVHTQLEETEGKLQRALKYTEAYKADVLAKEQDWQNKENKSQKMIDELKTNWEAVKTQLEKCDKEKLDLTEQLNLVKLSFAEQANTIQNMEKSLTTTSAEVNKYRSAMITVVGLLQPTDQDRAQLYFPEQFPALPDNNKECKNPIGPYLAAAMSQAEKKTAIKVLAPENIETIITPRKTEKPETPTKIDTARRSKNMPQKVNTTETVAKTANDADEEEAIQLDISKNEKYSIEHMDEDEKDEDDEDRTWKRKAKKRSREASVSKASTQDQSWLPPPTIKFSRNIRQEDTDHQSLMKLRPRAGPVQISHVSAHSKNVWTEGGSTALSASTQLAKVLLQTFEITAAQLSQYMNRHYLNFAAVLQTRTEASVSFVLQKIMNSILKECHGTGLESLQHALCKTPTEHINTAFLPTHPFPDLSPNSALFNLVHSDLLHESHHINTRYWLSVHHLSHVNLWHWLELISATLGKHAYFESCRFLAVSNHNSAQHRPFVGVEKAWLLASQILAVRLVLTDPHITADYPTEPTDQRWIKESTEQKNMVLPEPFGSEEWCHQTIRLSPVQSELFTSQVWADHKARYFGGAIRSHIRKSNQKFGRDGQDHL